MRYTQQILLHLLALLLGEVMASRTPSQSPAPLRRGVHFVPVPARRLDDPPPFAVPIPTMPSVAGPTVVTMPTVEGGPTVVSMPTVEGGPTVVSMPTVEGGPTAEVPTVPSPGVPTEKPNKVSIPTYEPCEFNFGRTVSVDDLLSGARAYLEISPHSTNLLTHSLTHSLPNSPLA